MKKETKKVLIKLLILLSLLLVIFTYTNISFAFDNFKGLGPSTSDPDAEKVKGKLATILGMLQFLGGAIAVGMLIWLGALYFMTSDTPEAKAETSKKAQSIFLGILFVVGATSILTLIKSTSTGIASQIT